MSACAAKMTASYAAGCSGWFSAAMTSGSSLFADIAKAVSVVLFRGSRLIVRLRLGVRLPASSPDRKG